MQMRDRLTRKSKLRLSDVERDRNRKDNCPVRPVTSCKVTPSIEAFHRPFCISVGHVTRSRAISKETGGGLQVGFSKNGG